MLVPPSAGRAFLARQAFQRRPRFSFRRPQSTYNNKSPKEPVDTEAKVAAISPTTPSSTSLSSKTIPGPIWLWTEPLNSYTKLHSRRPHTVQLISALLIYFIGDLTAQNIAPSPSNDRSGNVSTASTYDPSRTVRALLIGGLAAIPGYHWFLFLARRFNYKSKAFSIVVKVVINQIVFTPVFNSYFFGMQSALSGASRQEVLERIKHTVPRSWVNSWKVWPAVTAFSFAFVRVELRGLFAGVIAIGWQAYLSLLNQRAAKMEKQKLKATY